MNLVSTRYFYSEFMSTYDIYGTPSIPTPVTNNRTLINISGSCSSSDPFLKRLQSDPLTTVIPEPDITLISTCPIWVWILQNEANCDHLASLGLLPQNRTSLSVDRMSFDLFSLILHHCIRFSDTVVNSFWSLVNPSKETLWGLSMYIGFDDQFPITEFDLPKFKNCVSSVRNRCVYYVTDNEFVPGWLQKEMPRMRFVTFFEGKKNDGNHVSTFNLSQERLKNEIIEVLALALGDRVIGNAHSIRTQVIGAFTGLPPFVVDSAHSMCYTTMSLLSAVCCKHIRS